MDPRTALIIATLMMLLNGGILGLMHHSLSDDVKPSAVDWRIGTLLAAGGSLLLAVQESSPALLQTVGNGCLFAGVSLYWRSVRRFDGHIDTWWIFLPAVVATCGIFWFAAVTPNLGMRVLVSAIAWAIPLFAAAANLIKGSPQHEPTGRRVLAGILLVVAIFAAARGAYFILYAVEARSVLEAGHWLNAVTPLILAILPVIGTTGFLMMSSERIRRKWEIAATTDYLTGLPNRRTIYATGEMRFMASKQPDANFAVAIIDIDHFKSINDRFGHDMGDKALKHIALALENNCRGPNLVGRLGGEEFVVLLDGADMAAAYAAVERLRVAIAESPVELSGELKQITVSIGLSAALPHDRDLDDILRRADRALYAAKTNGRNRVEVVAG